MWRNLFDDDRGALFGPGTGLLRGRPSQEGKLRPGRLSTAVALRKKNGGGAVAMQKPPTLAVSPAAAAKAAGLIALGTSGAMQKPGGGAGLLKIGTGGAAVAPPLRTSTKGGGAAVAPPIRTGGGISTKGRGRGGLPPGAVRVRRGALAGLDVGLGDVIDDVPFNGNGQVWVTTSSLPLYSVQIDPTEGIPEGTRGAQMTWPDGTPVTGRFWLPKLDLSGAFDPRIPGTVDQDGDPRLRTLRGGVKAIERGTGGWVETQAMKAYYGTRAWEYVVGWNCAIPKEQARGVISPGIVPLPGNSGAAPFDVYWTDKIDNTCQSINDWFGRTAYIQHYGAVFDWSKYPPGVAAPIWVWLNLFDPTGLSWVVADAEIYRADLQKIDVAGEPYELPGSAWLCLDVLDAFATGAHGMPQIVDPVSGRIDPNGLAQFTANFPAWRYLLTYGRQNQAMLALINDLGAVAAGTVSVQPTTGGGGAGITLGTGAGITDGTTTTTTTGDTTSGDPGTYEHEDRGSGSAASHLIPYDDAPAGEYAQEDVGGWPGDELAPLDVEEENDEAAELVGDQFTPEEAAAPGDDVGADLDLRFVEDDEQITYPEGLIGLPAPLAKWYLTGGGRR